MGRQSHVRCVVVRLHQLYDWARRHPFVLDGTIIGLLGLLVVPVAVSYDRPVVAAAIGCGQLIPLLWRRRNPGLVFAVVSLACVAQVVAYDMWLASDFGFLFALYALSAYATRLWLRMGGLMVGALASASGRWSGPTAGPRHCSRPASSPLSSCSPGRSVT